MNKSALVILIFGFSALVSSACDFSTAICSSAGFSCPSSGSNFQVGSNNFGLSNIDVVSFDETTITNGDIQGRAATRNNFYGFNGVSVGDTLSDTLGYGLIAGGNAIIPENGAIYPLDGRFFVGSTASVPSYMTSRIDACTSGSSCLGSSFDSLYSYWNQFSSSVNSVADNMVFSINNGYGVLTCSAASRNYFVHVSGSDLSQVSSFCIVGCSSDANFVITITGDVSFKGRGLEVSGLLIYNIVSGTVTISTSVYGHIVAPNSNLIMTTGTIYGGVIAGNLSNIVQINQVTCASSAVPSRRSSDPFCDSLTGPIAGSSSTSSDIAMTTGFDASALTSTSGSDASASTSTTGSDADASTGSDASTSTSSDAGQSIGGGANSGSDNNEITSGSVTVIASFALAVVALVL